MSSRIYKCMNCQRRFEEPKVVKFYSGVEADGIKEVLHEERCPFCGSEYFTRYKVCPNCDDGLIDNDDIICPACKQAMLTYVKLTLRVGLNDNELKQLDEELDGKSVFDLF